MIGRTPPLQPVWKNHYRIPHVDASTNTASWQEFEIEITAEVGTQSQVAIEWHLDSDSSFVMGGWTIDDVEVFSVKAIP